MPFLTFRDGAGCERTLELSGGDLVVGRHRSSDLFLDDPHVSRRHLRIRPVGERWLASDLGSKHGTRINDEALTGERALAEGDRLQVGMSMLTFVLGRPELASPTTEGAVPEGLPVTEHTSAAALPGIVLLARDLRTGLVRGMGEVGPAAASAAPSNRLLEVLQLGTRLRTGRDTGSVARIAIAAAVSLVEARAGRVVLVDADTRQATISAAIGEPLDGEDPEAGFAAVGRRQLAAISGKQTRGGTLRAVLCAPLWDGESILGHVELAREAERPFDREELEIASAVASSTAGELARARMHVRVREEEERRGRLARFLSEDVIQHLEHARNPREALGVREQACTILFADIQGFTAMAERAAPSQVKSLLDDFFGHATEILVDHHGGTLDKYIGDAIMALFGAPFSRGDRIEAEHAVRAALGIRDFVEGRLRARPDLYEGLHVRIGIHTGRVIAGMMGSSRRAEYTVVGDAVNVASRVENACEGGRILVSQDTLDALDEDLFETAFAGARQFRNRTQPVDCWWIVRANSTATIAVRRTRES